MMESFFFEMTNWFNFFDIEQGGFILWFKLESWSDGIEQGIFLLQGQSSGEGEIRIEINKNADDEFYVRYVADSEEEFIETYSGAAINPSGWNMLSVSYQDFFEVWLNKTPIVAVEPTGGALFFTLPDVCLIGGTANGWHTYLSYIQTPLAQVYIDNIYDFAFLTEM